MKRASKARNSSSTARPKETSAFKDHPGPHGSHIAFPIFLPSKPVLAINYQLLPHQQCFPPSSSTSMPVEGGCNTVPGAYRTQRRQLVSVVALGERAVINYGLGVLVPDVPVPLNHLQAVCVFLDIRGPLPKRRKILGNIKIAAAAANERNMVEPSLKGGTVRSVPFRGRLPLVVASSFAVASLWYLCACVHEAKTAIIVSVHLIVGRLLALWGWVFDFMVNDAKRHYPWGVGG